MAQKKIKSATDQRKFTLVYNDFLESELLNYYEKMIFITLKRFANNDTMKAFPSLNTIHKLTGISLSQIRRSIEHMEILGVISVEHRTNQEKGNQSNLYILYDYAEIWNVDSSKDVTEIIDEVSEMKLVAALRAKGYTVIKEKVPETSEPTKVTEETSTCKSSKRNYKVNESNCQEVKEQYSIEWVKEHYEYEVMVYDEPSKKELIDAVINVIHNTLNTTKSNIKINSSDKPIATVISRLIKLGRYEILWAISKYEQQIGKIKNVESYLLTLLYKAKELSELEVVNQVKYDMYGQGTEDNNKGQ